ncbi:DNA gyrase/topoisomerase IV subunit A [Oscillatoria salina]|uniref:DNA gyrase/topoisomerase IV subunit A n=1 Tax=Oscillatoria salina TaxID=331517 RepID=UPI001CCFC31D|nr:DNA topoisomerase (ATP-hydrolyzing) [Oscillatoria salina]MBZ8178563.1 DNA topoisomerase 4 subunit A [Oscillatoria salina IIICB1]
MAKQLNLLGSGQIIPTALHAEMQRSYLEYAMSVIVGRALPDVRDGLKPVHRRILYAMHELGLTPDRPFRKCARVVGDVLGKYHPHGDRAVYDALVRMVQDFSSRYPLLQGHGNFGSVDNDPPAAMRYTETRLGEIANEAMLTSIGEATVDFTSNFDNSQQEPVVLPAQLPILLLNGCAGIAVGMATNIPPHNLTEVVDGIIALIDKPDLPDEKLWELIPGPDFPTGGEIVDTAGIKDTYATGRGIIPVRGVVKTERLVIPGRRRKERTALVVTELPFQVNKAAWIEKVADLVNQGRLEGIADIRDESDRSGMRVVVELKRDATAKKVLRQLYKQTPLQSNFGAIMLALVDNEPLQLPLRKILQEFIDFREETLTRQYNHELELNQRRLHLVAGLLAALKKIDRAIDLLRQAADGSTAKIALIEELAISEAQADAILAMPLRRLTGLERQKLQSEYEELETRIGELELLLGSRHELMKALKKELRSLKRKYGDDRRTRILSPAEVKKSALTSATSKATRKTKETTATVATVSESTPTIPDNAAIEVTEKGNIYWQQPEISAKKSDDLVVYSEPVAKNAQLIAIADTGKAYPVDINEIPPASQTTPTSLLSLLPASAQRDANRVVAQFFRPYNAKPLDLILLSEKGRIKRIPASELENLTNRGLMLIKFKDGDRLQQIDFVKEGMEMAIATSGGRILRFVVNDEQLPVMGRNALGNLAVRLRFHEKIVGCYVVNSDNNLLLISQQGYIKGLRVSKIRLGSLGDIGTNALQFAKKDTLAAMVLDRPNTQIIALTNTQRKIPIVTESVSFWGKDGIGDRLPKLKANETVESVICL